MSVVKVPDAGGHSLTLLDVDGQFFPTFPLDAIRNIPNLKLRDNDILISGYPKSGTHVIWELLRVLLKGSCDVENIEKDCLMIEQTSGYDMDKIASPRILNTHIPFSLLPEDVLKKKVKVLYLLRNPKDSAVSFYNHHVNVTDYYDYHGSFKDYLPLWCEGKVDYGSWFDHIRGWKDGLARFPDIPSLTVVYEEYMENPIRQVKKICQFLEKSHEEEFLQRALDWCSFESMRNRKGKHELTRDGHPVMYRKGKVGNWREWFTVAQNEWFDEMLRQKMPDLNINFKYTL